MDKLQPLITHRFWVATGLAVVLGLVGYWLGTSTLAETIDARTAKVTGLKPAPGAAQPNESWIDQAAEIAGERKATLEEVAERLAGTQEGLRVWPEGYRPYVEGLDYFGEIDLTGREAYRDYYPGEIESVRAVVRPYEDETKAGVVAMRPGVAPSFSTEDWPRVPPESNTIWAAQEDVWLLRELLARATDINEGTDSILDAPLKEIQSLTLQGGGVVAEVESGGGGGGGDQGRRSDQLSAGGDGMGSVGGMGDQDGRSGGGGAALPSAEFDLAEEVGPGAGMDDDPALAPPGADQEADAAGSADAQNSGRGRGMLDGMGDMGGGAGGEEPGAVSPGGGRRYIASAPELPYRTRAFQMTVVVDHRELPALLMSLANAAWPVEIVRVQSVAAVAPAGHAAAQRASGGGFGRGGGRREDDMQGGGDLGGIGGLGGGFGQEQDRGRGRDAGGPAGRGSFGRNRAAAPPPDPSDPYQVALADPYLVTAVVGGVMTIYKPLTEEEAAAQDAAGAAAGTTPGFGEDAPPAEPAETPAAGGDPVAGAGAADDPAAELDLGLDLPTADPAPADPAPADPADGPPADPGAGDGGPQPAAGATSDPAADGPPADDPPAEAPPAEAPPADDPTDIGDLPL